MQVTLVQGGGIGHELAASVRRILEAAKAPLVFDEILAGTAAEEKGQPALSPQLLNSIRSNRVALKTHLRSPLGKARSNYNILLRRELGLFASVRPLKNLRGVPARFRDIDMIVIRELTEDLYAAIEHTIVPGVVQSLKIVTRAACERFFRFAFDYARQSGRRTVHCVHKANILKLADGLFLEAFREIAQGFPDLQAKEIIVDNCCMQMVSKPSQFDVLVMGNLYGDIVSDLGTGIVGGVQTSAGINIGGDDLRVYECFRAGQPDASGQCSPLPLLIPAIDLLIGEGFGDCGRRIQKAVETVLETGTHKTPDLGGTSTTQQMTDAIISALS